MNKNILLIGMFAIVIGLISGCNRANNQQNSTSTSPTATASPVSTSPSPNNNTSQQNDPQNWTSLYDGVLMVEVKYPQQWHIQPATNSTGELGITSFDPNQTPDTGGVTQDQLKIGIVKFGPNDSRSSEINTQNVINQTTKQIDGKSATVYDIRGNLGTSKTAKVTTNDQTTFLISAYPYNSQWISEYNKVLDNLDLDAPPPVEIENIVPEELVTSPLTLEGIIQGNWMYEGQTNIELVTASDKTVKSGTITTDANWQTTDKIPFSSEISFQKPDAIIGYIYVQKSNPSGLPQNAQTFTFPIKYQ